MAHAVRRSRRNFRGNKRGTNWARLVETVGTTVAAGSKSLLSTLVLSNPGIAETVVRTNFMLHIASDQITAVELQLGAFGMIVVNDLALAAGAASIPGPVTDAGDDGWFVWQPFLTQSEGATSGEFGTMGITLQGESKAARRVEEGFGVAIMVENSHSTTGLVVVSALSMLSVVNT